METFEEFVINLKKSPEKRMNFIEYFYNLMSEKNLTEVDIYNNGQISRQTFSKIVSGKMKPSKNMAIKLALGLKCTNHECKLLLKKLDYTLASNSRFNLVIRYCIKYQIYDLNKVNNLLYDKCGKTLDD